MYARDVRARCTDRATLPVIIYFTLFTPFKKIMRVQHLDSRLLRIENGWIYFSSKWIWKEKLSFKTNCIILKELLKLSIQTFYNLSISHFVLEIFCLNWYANDDIWRVYTALENIYCMLLFFWNMETFVKDHSIYNCFFYQFVWNLIFFSFHFSSLDCELREIC